MVTSPARKLIPKNGRPDHTFTSTTAKRARRGVPSQAMGPLIIPTCISTQLITLYVESNIQVQASIASDVGTTHGISTAPRIHRIPGARCASTSARASPNASLAVTAASVYHTVLDSVRVKIAVRRRRMKFRTRSEERRVGKE